jgi:hypothetical protein
MLAALAQSGSSSPRIRPVTRFGFESRGKLSGVSGVSGGRTEGNSISLGMLEAGARKLHSARVVQAMAPFGSYRIRGGAGSQGTNGEERTCP